MIQPSIKKIADLQGWFVQVDKPCWALYAGNRITENSTPIAVNFTIDDIAGAWTELLMTLNRMGNVGTYTIVVRASKKDSAGKQSTILELNPNYYEPQQQQAAQIGSVTTINEMSPSVKQHIEESVREKLAVERRLMQSEYDMKALKSQLDRKETATDKLIGAFVQNPEKILLGIGSLFRGNTAQLGILTESNEVPPIETTETTEQVKTLDFNKVNQSAIVLFNCGVKDIDEILLKMATAAKANPSEAVQKFSMLKQYL